MDWGKWSRGETRYWRKLMFQAEKDETWKNGFGYWTYCSWCIKVVRLSPHRDRTWISSSEAGSSNFFSRFARELVFLSCWWPILARKSTRLDRPLVLSSRDSCRPELGRLQCYCTRVLMNRRRHGYHATTLPRAMLQYRHPRFATAFLKNRDKTGDPEQEYEM